MHRATTMDMTDGVIWKQIIALSLPLLAGNIFQQFYNTVDSIVVGNFVGAHALGAVTSVTAPINTLIGFFLGLSTGASVVISQRFGAGSIQSMRKAIHTAMILSMAIGLALTFFGVLVTPFLLRAMKTPEEIYPEALTYLRIYFSGILGLTVYNMGAAILRAVGDSRRPLFFLVMSSILNVIFDLFFVIALKLGVAGVGYATILSQFISCLLILRLLMRSSECYSLKAGEMKPDIPSLKLIFKIGVPAGLQMAITAFSNVFVQSYINSFGAASTSGWGVYARVDSFLNLPRRSISISVTTFVGQNAGARKVNRIKQGIRTALFISLAMTAVMSSLLAIWAPQIISLFNRDEDVLRFGTLFMRLLMPLSFLCCFNLIHAGALRGIGNARAPMLIMLGSFVVFRQIYLALVTRLTTSVQAVALGYPAGWVVCSAIMYLYFRFSGWERKVAAQPSEKN